MAIVFNCSGCGNKMQAPDNLAGQKARCPSCQIVLTVPEPVYEAEEVPAYPPEPSPPARPAGIPLRPIGSPFSDEPEPAAGDQKPCPMCGEMILARALKCRFCGEIFDPALRRRRSGSPDELRTMHSLMNGVGGLWIFLACLFFLSLVALQDELARAGSTEAVFVVLGAIGVCWLLFGIVTCTKQIWGVYAGLVLSYLVLLLTLIGMVAQLSERGGAGACSGIFSVCLVGAGIVQSHRIIGIYGRMDSGRRHYD